MCRMLSFIGTCTRCGDPHTWDDLAQLLSCLEAKNNGGFGECSKGTLVEEHKFDQECARCAEEDEGVGDVGQYETPTKKYWKRGAEHDAASAKSKRQKT